jgi:hypothetical protein
VVKAACVPVCVRLWFGQCTCVRCGLEACGLLRRPPVGEWRCSYARARTVIVRPEGGRRRPGLGGRMAMQLPAPFSRGWSLPWVHPRASCLPVRAQPRHCRNRRRERQPRSDGSGGRTPPMGHRKGEGGRWGWGSGWARVAEAEDRRRRGPGCVGMWLRGLGERVGDRARRCCKQE